MSHLPAIQVAILSFFFSATAVCTGSSCKAFSDDTDDLPLLQAWHEANLPNQTRNRETSVRKLPEAKPTNRTADGEKSIKSPLVPKQSPELDLEIKANPPNPRTIGETFANQIPEANDPNRLENGETSIQNPAEANRSDRTANENTSVEILPEANTPNRTADGEVSFKKLAEANPPNRTADGETSFEMLPEANPPNHTAHGETSVDMLPEPKPPNRTADGEMSIKKLAEANPPNRTAHGETSVEMLPEANSPNHTADGESSVVMLPEANPPNRMADGEMSISKLAAANPPNRTSDGETSVEMPPEANPQNRMSDAETSIKKLAEASPPNRTANRTAYRETSIKKLPVPQQNPEPNPPNRMAKVETSIKKLPVLQQNQHQNSTRGALEQQQQQQQQPQRAAAEQLDLEFEDPALSDLSESDAEQLQQQGAALKMEKLTMVEKREGNGDRSAQSKLESDLIEGKKGPEVIKAINDVLNTIHGPVDELVKMGVGMTGNELQQLSNLELGTHERQDEKEDEESESEAGEDNTTNSPHALLSTGQGAPCRSPSCYRLWPKVNGMVRIRYCRGEKKDSEIGASNEIMNTFKMAAGDLTEYCEALKFEEVSDDGSCQMRVYSGRSASTGYLRYKPNTVRCDERSGAKGLCMHEITHGLGRTHEHTRVDRDDHVTVHWDVVTNGHGNNNFKKKDKASINLPYDLYSIMHYDCERQIKKGAGFFDRSLRSHRRRNWWDGRFGWEDCSKMGQMIGYDHEDIRTLQEMYSCSDRRRRASPPASRRRRWYS